MYSEGPIWTDLSWIDAHLEGFREQLEQVNKEREDDEALEEGD